MRSRVDRRTDALVTVEEINTRATVQTLGRTESSIKSGVRKAPTGCDKHSLMFISQYRPE